MHLIKNFFGKGCSVQCPIKGNLIKSQDYRVIWSQKVDKIFLTRLSENLNLFLGCWHAPRDGVKAWLWFSLCTPSVLAEQFRHHRSRIQTGMVVSVLRR